MNTEMTNEHYTIQEKLHILADAAKLRCLPCTSKRLKPPGDRKENSVSRFMWNLSQLCGRRKSISLLKILMTNIVSTIANTALTVRAMM